MPSRTRVALLLAPALTAAACSSHPAPAPRTYQSPTALSGYAAADAQYRQLQKGLSLPRGVRFPAHLLRTSDQYPSDAGTVAAQNYWLCAWLRASLTAPQHAKALRQLPNYVRMDAYTKALDPKGRTTVTTTLYAAAKGSTKPVAAFTKTTCGGPFYTQANPR